MDSNSFLSGLGNAVASPLKLTGKVFEIRAVDKQASSLLETINQVNGQLEVARDLRRQKSSILTATEKKLTDETFDRTDRQISHVGALVEKCRVALKTDNGNIAMRTKIMFVLRDSPRIQTSLHQLTIAGQSLNMVCLLLISRENEEVRKITRLSSDARFAPPSYAEHNFLIERRSRNLLRKASSSVSTISEHDHGFPNLSETIKEIDEEELESINWDAGSEQTGPHKDELFFEHRASLPTNYLPYRAGWTSPSMTSLQSLSSTTSDTVPRGTKTPTDGLADGFRELAMRRRGQSLPAQPLTNHEGDTLKTKATPDLSLSGSAQAEQASVNIENRPTSSDRDSLPSQRALAQARTSRDMDPSQVRRRPVPGPKPAKFRSGSLDAKLERPLSAISTRSEDSQSSHISQPVFVLQTSEDPESKPLFSKMVKIDLKDEASDVSEKLSNDKLSESKPSAESQPTLESQLPEVVPAESAPEPIAISSESADGMLTRARSKRYISIESRSRREAAKALPPVPQRGPEFAPEVVMPDDSPQLLRPASVHSQRDSDSVSVRSLAVSTNQASGRARSRRWQELQFERSEKLAKASTPD